MQKDYPRAGPPERADPAVTICSGGAVAEWLGRGLQSLAHRFDSGPRLFL
jgi:hypothetical protein